jgi:membrane-bound ClpP family serine protease
VRRRPVTTGVVSLIDQTGFVRSSGMVFVNGELWRAQLADGSAPIPGSRVRIEAIEDMKLIVRAASSPRDSDPPTDAGGIDDPAPA